tara:strand:+ start:232 stop:801 length:570 start_codon:yes stop_codon:yes gene_type:complete
LCVGKLGQRDALVAVMAESTKPWDFRQGGKPGHRESTEAYRCFRIYLELGRERNNKIAAEVAGQNKQIVDQYASKYQWAKRAAAWDAVRVTELSEEAREEFNTTHKKALIAFKKDTARRAESLGKVADLLITVTTDTLEDMVASGEPVDRQQLAAIANTAAKLAEVAMNTSAAALGVDDLIEAINPEQD